MLRLCSQLMLGIEMTNPCLSKVFIPSRESLGRVPVKEACGCTILGRETARSVHIGGTGNSHEHEYRKGHTIALSFIEAECGIVTLVT